MANTHREELSSDPQAVNAQNAWEGSTINPDESDRDIEENPSSEIRTSNDTARLQMIQRAQSARHSEDSTADAIGPFDTTPNWESEPTTQGDTWEYPKPAKTSDAVGGISPNPWEGEPIDGEE